jgi:signal transduction histidine kinase
VALAEALILPPEPSERPEDRAEAADEVGALPTIRRFAALVQDVFDCQRVQVGLVDASTDRYTPMVMVGQSPEEAHQDRGFFAEYRLGEYLTAEQRTDLQQGRVIVVDATHNPQLRRAMGTPSAASVLIAPLLRGEAVVGLMGLRYAQEDPPFGPETQSLVRASARLATMILEQERLMREREEAHATVLAMQEASKQMDAFVGIASHELKTPITAASLTLQATQRRLQNMRRESTVPSTLGIELEGMGRQVTRIGARMWQLNRLVNDLVDVTRIKAGKLEVHPELVDLGPLVQQVVEEQRELAAPRTIQLRLPPVGQQVLVSADADRIGQVITNYLTNALKYSPADRPVEVGLDVEDPWVRVWVRDQGPGLPEEERERVWQRYHRVPGIAVQSGGGVGLGLGLSIVREIIARHDGEVGVESTPGQGSTFWFTLALAQPTEQSPEQR